MAAHKASSWDKFGKDELARDDLKDEFVMNLSVTHVYCCLLFNLLLA